jgi:glycosyltransferase involved in cell wall biosynthesis
MAAAFSELGINLRLIAKQGDPCLTDAELMKHYGEKPDSFAINRVVVPKIRILSSIVFALKSFLLCLQNKPDLFYARNLWSALLILLLRKSTIIELHDIPRSWIARLNLKILCRSAPVLKIVCISEALRDDLLHIEPAMKAKLVVMHDGAKAEHVTPEISNLQFDVSYFGSLYKGKGIEIISSVAPLMPRIEFHIFGGSSSEVSDCRSIVDEKNVYFHGRIPPADVPKFMVRSKCLLLPSQKIMESFGGGGDIGKYTSPLKLFEYMSSKRPIISSNLENLKEVITHNETALLVDADDVQGWVEAIDTLLHDEVLSENLAKEAYSLLVSEYTWIRRCEKILALLKVCRGQ